MGYTVPRIDKKGQMLVCEDRTIVDGHCEYKQAILQTHFSPDPSENLTPPADKGQAFWRVDEQLVHSLLKVAANTSALRDGWILAGIVKVFWWWNKQQITQLVHVCIRLGFYLGIWKTVKSVVIPKLGKPITPRCRHFG